MATFLFKTEPGEYAFDDLLRDRKTVWSGVTNNAALMHLRTARPADPVLIYHTGAEKAVVGLAEILTMPYPDPARPAMNAKGEPAFPVVEIKPIKKAPHPVTLAALKSDPRFKAFALVTQGRLSIMPVPSDLAKLLRTQAGL